MSTVSKYSASQKRLFVKHIVNGLQYTTYKKNILCNAF